MGEWRAESKSHVSTMDHGDFRSTEQSVTLNNATNVTIEHEDISGSKTVLKDGISLLEGEIIDAAVMNKKALLRFLDIQIKEAKETGVLFSLHMKATMMKVSDPIIFGHAVKIFFKDVFEKHAETIQNLGVDTNNGFGDLIS